MDEFAYLALADFRSVHVGLSFFGASRSWELSISNIEIEPSACMSIATKNIDNDVTSATIER